MTDNAQNTGTPDLSVDIAGVKLGNPLMTASGTCGYADEYADFTFGDLTETSRVEIPTTTQKLNADGNATITVSGPAVNPSGLWRARVATTVTEPGGRSVSANVTCNVDTSGRHIGLQLADGRVVPEPAN